MQTASKQTDVQQKSARALAESIELMEPQVLVIYGGLKNREWIEPELNPERKYIWLNSWSNQRFDGLRARKKAAKEKANSRGRAIVAQPATHASSRRCIMAGNKAGANVRGMNQELRRVAGMGRRGVPGGKAGKAGARGKVPKAAGTARMRKRAK